MYNKNLFSLVAINSIVIVALVILSNALWLPMKIGDFVFMLVLLFLFSLYRPGWIFFWLAGTIMLETINLAPSVFGMSFRPYQLLALVAFLAVFIRFIARRLTFSLEKPRLVDFLLPAMAVGGFVGIFNAPQKEESLKLAVIFVSFLLLYWLARNFVQKQDDIKKIAPFFLAGSSVVMAYGIWQAVRFSHGLEAFETMLGRPNATFPEADWLGMYLTFLLSVTYAIIYYINTQINIQKHQILNFKFSILNKFSISKFTIVKTLSYLILTSLYSVLILTVSRSAWLGVAIVTLAFLKIVLTELKFNPRLWQWKRFFAQLVFIFSAVIASIAAIYFFNLTNFQLFNRAQSTGTGLQKITVACNTNSLLYQWPLQEPMTFNSEDEIRDYNCWQINLEDIQKWKTDGYYVTEVYRPDPNVGIRAKIYRTSWEQIKKHPVLGIGWGSIGEVLGKDERGAAFNSSNIFLEVWLGSGLVGFTAFLTLWIWIFWKSISSLIKSELADRWLHLFILLGAIAILVPNMFNAGIFLGYVWIYLGAVVSLILYSKRPV